MPNLEISLPDTNPERKRELGKKLNDDFRAFSDMGVDLSIRFFDYKEGEVYTTDGRIYVHFLLYSPPLETDVKKKLIESFSNSFKFVTGMDSNPIIHICEYPYENIGVEGKCLTELKDASKN